ncbi:hypothetical protein [Kytococcus sp. Marseille-QA3725]
MSGDLTWILFLLAVGAVVVVVALVRWRTAPPHRAHHRLSGLVGVIAFVAVYLPFVAVVLAPDAWFSSRGVDPSDGRAVFHLAFPLASVAALVATAWARRRWPVAGPPEADPVRPPASDLEATRLGPDERVLWTERPLPLLGWSGWLGLAVVAVFVWLVVVADGVFAVVLSAAMALVMGVWALVLQLDRSTTSLRVSARGVRVVAWWGRDVREAVPLAAVLEAVPIRDAEFVSTDEGVLWSEGGTGPRRRWMRPAPQAVMLRLTGQEVLVVGTRRAEELAALVNGLVAREAEQGMAQRTRQGMARRAEHGEGVASSTR